MAKVLFKFGYQEDYDRLKQECGTDPYALYFIEDNGRLYKGDLLMSQQVMLVDEAPLFEEAKEDILYVIRKEDKFILQIKGSEQMMEPTVSSVELAHIDDSDVDYPLLMAISNDLDQELSEIGKSTLTYNPITQELKNVVIDDGSID